MTDDRKHAPAGRQGYEAIRAGFLRYRAEADRRETDLRKAGNRSLWACALLGAAASFAWETPWFWAAFALVVALEAHHCYHMVRFSHLLRTVLNPLAARAERWLVEQGTVDPDWKGRIGRED